VKGNIAVKRIINNPIDSNSFVLYRKGYKNCVVVDPGTLGCENLLLFLNKSELIPEYIILTHEHFDHIWGINKLKDVYNSKIVCSEVCSVSITDIKKNMSVFYNQVGFKTYPADIIVDSSSSILWHNIPIRFMETHGHTDGSMCILVDKKLFTGDTIIQNSKTVVKFPGGNREKLRLSLNMIFSRFMDKDIYVYPGHGSCCFLSEISNEDLI
jgi:hydroxyacylglutathione hydrolase